MSIDVSKIKAGDIVEARFTRGSSAVESGDFVTRGVAYEYHGSPYTTNTGLSINGVSLTSTNRSPGRRLLEIIEHVPAVPEWHSALAIEATVPSGRRLFVRNPDPRDSYLWVSWSAYSEGCYAWRADDLSDVKIMVDKNGATR